MGCLLAPSPMVGTRSGFVGERTLGGVEVGVPGFRPNTLPFPQPPPTTDKWASLNYSRARQPGAHVTYLPPCGVKSLSMIASRPFPTRGDGY